MLGYAVCSIHDLNIYYFDNIINTSYTPNYLFEQERRGPVFLYPKYKILCCMVAPRENASASRDFRRGFSSLEEIPNSQRPFFQEELFLLPVSIHMDGFFRNKPFYHNFIQEGKEHIYLFFPVDYFDYNG